MTRLNLLRKNSALGVAETLALLGTYTPEQMYAVSLAAFDYQLRLDASLMVDHHFEGAVGVEWEDLCNDLLDKGEATLRELDLNDPRARQLLAGWWNRSIDGNTGCAHLTADAKHLEEVVGLYTCVEMCNALHAGTVNIEAVQVVQ